MNKRSFWRTSGLSVVAVATVATLYMGVEITGAQQAQGGAGSLHVAANNPAPQSAGRQSGAVANSAQAASAVAAYWTADRMANAIPKDVGLNSPASAPSRASGGATGATGPEVRGGGANLAKLPVISTGTTGAAHIPSPSAAATSISPQQTGVYPSPFTRWEWFGKYRTFPQSTIAKVFFTQGSTNFVCSGSVARPGVVDTAGHCANSGGQGDPPFVGPQVWSTNVQVCPSYDASQGGVNPNVGCWVASDEWVDGGWFSFGDFDDDFGSFVMGNNGGRCNCQIQNVTGFLGFMYNGARDQHWIAQGYPQASPFNGGKIQTNAGEWWADQAGCGSEGCSYPKSVSQGNDLTGGSSGGPWIAGFGCEFNAGGDSLCNQGNFLNGHNDWKFGNQPLSMQSPYYNGNWANVTNSACHEYQGNQTNCV